MKIEIEDSTVEQMIAMIESADGCDSKDVAEFRGILELARAARIIKMEDWSAEC